MMEQWNDGIMGSGKMENRVVDRIPLGREVNRVNMINFLLKPTFQYSTIPLFHVQGRSSDLEKNLYSQ